MDYKLFTKNIELTKALEDYLEKRMEKIDRMFKKHDDLLMGTEIRVEKDREICGLSTNFFMSSKENDSHFFI